MGVTGQQCIWLLLRRALQCELGKVGVIAVLLVFGFSLICLRHLGMVLCIPLPKVW